MTAWIRNEDRVAPAPAARREGAEERLDAALAQFTNTAGHWGDLVDDLTDLIRDLTPVDD